jgi:hypothetical protein
MTGSSRYWARYVCVCVYVTVDQILGKVYVCVSVSGSGRYWATWVFSC